MQLSPGLSTKTSEIKSKRILESKKQMNKTYVKKAEIHLLKAEYRAYRDLTPVITRNNPSSGSSGL